MNEHCRTGAGRPAGGQARPGRKADGDQHRRGARALRVSKGAKGVLVCAPHIVLSSDDTGACTPDVACGKNRPRVVLASRALWMAGPWWGQWYYRRVAGPCSISAVYNLMSLCGFMGPVQRVCAMVGTAIAQRVAEGVKIAVQSDDNAQVLLDFGDSRLPASPPAFTMQKYRSPAIELYGTDGRPATAR
jgi:hypothetical protein